MVCPSNSHDATHLIRVMEAAGMEISVTVQGRAVLVDAADDDGQVYVIQRDDGDLLAAVMRVALDCGFEFD